MKSPVTIAVEGEADKRIVMRLLELVDIPPGAAYVLRGKDKLDEKLAAYNRAAAHERWLILRDLDQDASCAASLRLRLLPVQEAGMQLRVAVRAAEAWLLADQDGISRFLRVGASRVPMHPDDLDNPKIELVNLARRSRDRAIREDMVPEEGMGRSVGAGYPGRVIEFASRHWDPRAAAMRSDSLRRCIQALQRWS